MFITSLILRMNSVATESGQVPVRFSARGRNSRKLLSTYVRQQSLASESKPALCKSASSSRILYIYYPGRAENHALWPVERSLHDLITTLVSCECRNLVTRVRKRQKTPAARTSIMGCTRKATTGRTARDSWSWGFKPPV